MKISKSRLLFIMGVTAVMSVVVTLVVVAVLLSIFGTEKVAKDVSPFVENTQKKVVESIMPPSQQREPKTEADLIMDSVAQNQGSSVLIYKRSSSTADTFVARGIILSTDGLILTDASVLKEGTTYMVSVPGMQGSFMSTLLGTTDGLALLKIEVSTSLIATFGEGAVSIDELVVAVTGTEKMQIATGIVTDPALEKADVVRTNIVGAVAPGSMLVSKNGAVLGISTVAAQGGTDASFKLLTSGYISDFVQNSNSQMP